MAISTIAVYIYDEDLLLDKQGTLEWEGEFDGQITFTFSELEAQIEQGDIGVTRLVFAVPVATFDGSGSPLVTFRRQDGYLSSMLTMNQSSYYIDDVQYQVFYIDLTTVGWTYKAGRHAVQCGYLVGSDYDSLPLVFYTVQDGINDYAEVTADTYEEISNQFLTVYSNLLGQVANLEGYAQNAFNYNGTIEAGVDYIQWLTTPRTEQGDLPIGARRYNDDFKTTELRLSSSVVIQDGQKIVIRVRNGESTDIVNGDVVYIYGEVGNSGKVLAKRASSTVHDQAISIIGVATETFAVEGFVTVAGRVSLDVSAYDLGTRLYLGTNGNLVTIDSLSKGANMYVCVGIVESNDRLLVDPRIHYNLDDSSNVETSGKTVNDLLIWNGTKYVNITKTSFLSALQAEVDANTSNISTLQTDKEDKTNKITAWNTPTDVQYPSAKLTKDTLDLKEDKTNKGVASGYAPLNASALIDSVFLPSYVDDVIEVATYADLPATGESGKLYLVVADETTGGDPSTYRWTGSTYMLIHDQMSAAELKVLYESNADTNAFTDSDKTKLEGLDDQTTLDGKFALKVDKTQTIASVDLQDNITQEELKIALDIDDLETDNTQNKSDIVDLKLDVVDHEHRIDSIEEATRKQDSDIASVDDDGLGILHMGKDVAETTVTTKIEGLLLDSEQLIDNSEFEDGITGWSDSGTITKNVTNGIVEIISGTNNSGIFQQLNIIGTKLYHIIRYKSSTQPYLTISTPYQEVNYPIATEFAVYSSIVNTTTNTNFNLILRNRLATQILYIDYIYTFNISTLISNKQYSPLYSTTFDLMTDEQIKAQMDLWVETKTLPNSIMSVDMDKRVTSVGKNLFDKGSSKNISGFNITSTGALASNSPSTTTHKIEVKAGQIYTMSNVDGRYRFLDVDDNIIEVGFAGSNRVAPSGAKWIQYAFTTATFLNNTQLEVGTVATTYEPYRSSSMYLDSGEVGYSYQGTRDTIEFRNGEALFINRVNDTQDGLRTTPIETPISVIGNAMAYPNGTFLIEDVVRRSGVYSSGITVDKPIKTLDNIYKLNDDGSSTKLEVSGATVAGDGLSFTHTSLSNGDFVWFDYYYQGTNVKGLSTVYYYGDKLIVADTTTGTVYKIIFTIDNGVITVDKVAV